MSATLAQPAAGTEKITSLVFACRWCALLGAERAGRGRVPMNPGFRLLPVECAGAIPLDILLRAFADGAHGVAVMGCHFGGCRHNEANRNAHARLEILATALGAVGMRPERLLLSWGTAHEGHQFASVVNDFMHTLQTLKEEPDLALLQGVFPLPTCKDAHSAATIEGGNEEVRP
jgi:coenzyme F420-reducing hydrogenase delta subunit